MSTFKRNSRFSREGGSSEGKSSSNSGSRFSKSSSEKGDNKFPFTRIGSLTTPKKLSDELKEAALDELRGSDMKLNLKIYPPKGVDEITLRRDDLVLISFKVSDKDKDFVIGHAMVANESDSE